MRTVGRVSGQLRGRARCWRHQPTQWRPVDKTKVSRHCWVQRKIKKRHVNENGFLGSYDQESNGRMMEEKKEEQEKEKKTLTG